MKCHKIIESLLIIYITVVNSDSGTFEVCEKCSCKGKNESLVVECLGDEIVLEVIPKNFPLTPYEINFSGQNFSEIHNDAFSSPNLASAMIINLENCKIFIIHEAAFNCLANLITLDLSHNFLEKLDKRTFKDNVKLRWLSVAHNNIHVVQAELFSALTDLQVLDLSYNEIASVENEAFVENTQLQEIRFHTNRLTTLDASVFNFDQIHHLSGVTFYNNPWNCDCFLKEFLLELAPKVRLSLEDLIPQCESLKSVNCRLELNINPNGTRRVDANENITLSCEVMSEVKTNITWTFNNLDIQDDLVKYKMMKYQIDAYNLIYTLSIHGLETADSGLYGCVTKFRKGQEGRFMALIVMDNSIQKLSDRQKISARSTKDERHPEEVDECISNVYQAIIICMAVVVIGNIVLIVYLSINKNRYNTYTHWTESDNKVQF